jgi:hypothetical protein
MPERGIGIDEGHGRRLPHRLEHGAHVEAALRELLIIGGKHRDTVRVDPAQIGLDHGLRRRVGVGIRHPPGAEHGLKLALDMRRADSHRSTPGLRVGADQYASGASAG